MYSGELDDLAGLNPCSNGIWSLTCEFLDQTWINLYCLNPCSNGIWSLTIVVLDSTSFIYLS